MDRYLSSISFASSGATLVSSLRWVCFVHFRVVSWTKTLELKPIDESRETYETSGVALSGLLKFLNEQQSCPLKFGQPM
jgi:hypothetical protein